VKALAEAVAVDVEGTPARVFTAEHLAAIDRLQTERAKDHARLLQFIEATAINAERFQDLVHRYELLDKWQTFERRFL